MRKRPLTAENLEERRNVTQDNGRTVGEVAEGLIVRGRQFVQQGWKWCNGLHGLPWKLSIEHRRLLVLVELEILKIGLAAIVVTTLVGGAAIFCICFRHLHHLASVFTQNEARRAEEHGKQKDDI